MSKEIKTRKLAEHVTVCGDIVHVLQLRTAANSKLGKGAVVIQTYHFNMDQVINNDLTLDGANCFDCPFSYNQNDGKSGGCYTHKGNQLMGLKAILRMLHNRYKTGSLGKSISLDAFIAKVGKYDLELVRFGSYGEPVLMDIEIVQRLAAIPARKRWTGYTHQWNKEQFAPYSAYFMASCHSAFDSAIATDMGWRPFIATDSEIDGAVNCPASKEAGRRSTCAKCALCNGTTGNSSKAVFILTH